jgi:hypothetical protein
VNKNLYFIAWNLVWFDVYVVEFEFKCSPLLFVFFIFLDVWYVFLENFMFFCVFLSFDLFRFKYLFWFNFGFLVFGSVNGWTSIFGSTRTSQNYVKYLRLYLVCHCFDKMNFSWRACLANTSLDLFWQFYFFLNMVLCNDPKKKNNSCKNNKKLFLLIAYYSIRITNCIFYKKEKKVFFSMVLENNCIDFPLQFFLFIQSL